ncbi:MAG: hypothetical protein VYE46_05690, partial [Cyanobacteriota bacterium]|nr:hypothetical protein [Cyanobacteriota bacterium]
MSRAATPWNQESLACVDFIDLKLLLQSLIRKNQFFSSSRSPGVGSVLVLLAGSWAQVPATDPFIC